MILGDLIYNTNFDVNCNYIVRANSDIIIHDTRTDGYVKLYDIILDKKITYLTIENNTLIIEIDT